MGWKDWLDVRIIQVICRHTVTAAAAMLSWMLLFWLGRLGIHSSAMQTVLERIENLVLIVLILFSVWNILEELLPNAVKAAYAKIIEYLSHDSSKLAFI